MLCPANALAKVTTAVTAPGMSKELISSELIYKSAEDGANESLSDELLESVSKLVEQLEADEDVLRVWTTLD